MSGLSGEYRSLAEWLPSMTFPIAIGTIFLMA
jgi:hypothetical protein